MSRDRKITIFERELRRFTRVQVALSPHNPENGESTNFSKNIIYLGDRVAFEVEDETPNCDDIVQFFESKMDMVKSQIDNTYAGIIKRAIESYREKEEKRLSDECEKDINEYFNSLDRNLELDVENNADKSIQRLYQLRVGEIKSGFDQQRIQVEIRAFM